MKPAEFPEVNLRIAEHQDQYVTLPVHKRFDAVGSTVCCFELSDEEKKEIMETGKIWLDIWTFDKPFPPILLATKREDMSLPVPEEGS